VGGPVNSNYNNYYNNPNNAPRTILAQLPAVRHYHNQQILQSLADGTGGFAIYNTNDLLGGLKRFAKDQNEFYLLGYVPSSSPEGSCHSLKVKMDHGGMNVRSRSGYCNVTGPRIRSMGTDRKTDGVASGRESARSDSRFAAGAVLLFGAERRPGKPGDGNSRDSLIFNKDKGKYHANVNVLGIAYNPDGSGRRAVQRHAETRL